MSNTSVLSTTDVSVLAPFFEIPEMRTSLLAGLQALVPESALDIRLKGALEHARRMVQMHDSYSHPDAAIAWETVEELERAKASRQAPQLSGFERYCLESPHAKECRIYDV